MGPFGNEPGILWGSLDLEGRHRNENQVLYRHLVDEAGMTYIAGFTSIPPVDPAGFFVSGSELIRDDFFGFWDRCFCRVRQS